MTDLGVLKVSVCIPLYNGMHYIEEQLMSILTSSLVSEVIVSDDGSTDFSRDVVASVNDDRVRLINGPQEGLIKNYEFLLATASGDFIFLADQDDVWLPNKVEIMLGYLKDNILVVSDCTVVGKNLAVIHRSFFALRNSKPGLIRNLIKNNYLGCCLAFRKDLLKRALPFPANLPMHDWWLGLIAEASGKVAFIDKQLVLYRRHGSNTSTASEPSQVGWATRIGWRLVLAKAILNRLS